MDNLVAAPSWLLVLFNDGNLESIARQASSGSDPANSRTNHHRCLLISHVNPPEFFISLKKLIPLSISKGVEQ
jgi:hypothetical protein